MLLVENDVVFITRGDDAELEVNIVDGDGDAYTMVDGDKLVLTVRELPDFASPVMFTVESASNRIILSHDDTADAEVGRYSADIELHSGGLRRTIWPKLEDGARYKVRNFRNFIVMPEVTQ